MPQHASFSRPEHGGAAFLVARFDKVVRKCLDSLCRVACHLAFAIVSDQDGLFRLDGNDSCPSLLRGVW